MAFINKRTSLKRLIYLPVFVAVIFFVSPLYVFSADDGEEQTQVQDGIIEQQSASPEVKSIEDQLKKHSENEFGELVDGYNPEGLISDAARGKFTLDIPGLLNNVGQFLLKEIYQNIHILVKLIVLAILCAVLKHLQASFLSENVGELAFYVCYIVVVIIIISGFNTALGLAIEIIDGMVNFMYATIPVLITLLVAGGNVTSGGVFQPVMLMIVEVSATIIKNLFIPLIFLSSVLSIVNNISEKIQLSRLSAMIKQISVWTLGIILTVFAGVVSVQGSLGAVVDGVASKTAKFALGAFIPVVGKQLADAADTVLGCTLLIKNAAGLAVMIGIIAICLVPLLKIAAIVGLYKLSCVIIEPVSDKRITACINDVSNSMLFILGVSAAVAIMFLISVTAVISAGNLSSMIR